WQAAELYRQAGLSNAARAGFVRYVEEFPAPLGQRVEATQQLLELALETGDQRAARRWRQAIVDADAKAGPERTERTRFLAAQAVLALAEEPHRAYQRIKLVEPLQTSLRSKQRAFKRTLAAYERAAGYKVAAVTTAASYAIATLYADFAKALLESERPARVAGRRAAGGGAGRGRAAGAAGRGRERGVGAGRPRLARTPRGPARPPPRRPALPAPPPVHREAPLPPVGIAPLDDFARWD